MRPDVRAVRRDVDRDIAHDLDAPAVGVGLELLPLPVKLELHVHVELDVKVQLAAVVVQRVTPAQTDVLRPLGPDHAAEEFVHRHEQRVVVQPPVVLAHELLVVRVMADVAALVRLAQELKAVLVQRGIVHIGGIAAKVDRVDLLLREHTLLHQRLQADEVRIAGKRGERLVRRIARRAVAGRAQRQNLPVGLSGAGQPVHKIIRFLREAADAVFGGQAGHGKQNASGTFHTQISFIAAPVARSGGSISGRGHARPNVSETFPNEPFKNAASGAFKYKPSVLVLS